ncbi:hypothetical protein KM927_28035 [Priestia megaterium]|uniref:hypothetical protein n=1 Tax=Priestia megaterium TaxID=1404 RepID=UPI001C216E41|nr:hypothetical protein [Priestia megaterium]MBU8757322.1 hypothetical protein [Priestia megaterium]
MNVSKIVLIALIAFDLFFLLLAANHYSLVALGSACFLFIITVNLVLLLAWAIGKKLNRGLVLIFSFVGFGFLFVQSFLFILTPTTFDSVSSPSGSEKVYIEHRNFSLGETSYSYNFYQRKGKFFMKELVDQNQLLVTRDNLPGGANDIKMLGLDVPHWINEKEVRFNSRQGTITIHLD